MKTSNRTLAAIAVLAAALIVLLLLFGRPPPDSRPPVAPPVAGAQAPEDGAAPLAPPATDRPEPSSPTPGEPGRESGEATATPPPDQPDGPAKPGEVVGVVLLLPGRSAVAGAKVRLRWGKPDLAGVARPRPDPIVTGSNGVFRFGGVPSGIWLFEVTLAGHGPRSLRAVVPPGAGVDGLEVVFGSGGGVEGCVEGPDGPAAGVRVRINNINVGGGPGLLSCSTDEQGRYRFDDLDPGDYSVEIDDGRDASVHIGAGGMARLDFPGGASLGGIVTDADGTPLAGAVVRVRRSEGGYAATQTRTGKDGRYRLASLAPGTVVVGIQVLGEAGFSVDLVETTLTIGENRADLDLGRADWGCEVSGRVFDASTGAALSNRQTQITLRLEEVAEGEKPFTSRWFSMAFADQRGAFRFRALRAGRYRLYVHSFAGHIAADREIKLARGERKTGLEIGLEQAPKRTREKRAPEPSKATLTGTVLDAEGRPLSGAYVRAQPAAGGERYRQDRTDGTGRYHIRRLEPGPWTVSVQVVGTGAFAAKVADVEILLGENTLDVQLGKGDLSGEIRGRVFERVSGKPLSSRDVQIALYTVGPDGKPRYGASAWADAKGEFRIPYVRPGSYRLRGWPTKGGLARRDIDVTLRAGEVLEGVELALEPLPTGRVRFEVRDPDGAPVRLVSIESLRDGKRRQGSMTANSPSGVYATNFEAGTHDVTIRDPNSDLCWSGSVEVREGETSEVSVVLRHEEGGK